MKLVPGELGALVDRFMHAMHRFDGGRTVPLLHRSGITTAQLAVLEYARQPRLVSEIAVHLGLSRPATSQLVDKLARAGLIRRSEGARDRRQRNVIVSAKGSALVARIAAARAARFTSSLSAVPRALATRFAVVLDEVVAALQEQER